MMQFSWFWLKFLCTTLTDKSELFKSPHEYFFLFVLTHSIKICGQILLRGHISLMFHCCFNCDSIHLSEAFGLPELKMCWYLCTIILSRIASILQKSFNLKFYDTFPVFLYCFDSYPGRKVEWQDCKILIRYWKKKNNKAYLRSTCRDKGKNNTNSKRWKSYHLENLELH